MGRPRPGDGTYRLLGQTPPKAGFREGLVAGGGGDYPARGGRRKFLGRSDFRKGIWGPALKNRKGKPAECGTGGGLRQGGAQAEPRTPGCGSTYILSFWCCRFPIVAEVAVAGLASAKDLQHTTRTTASRPTPVTTSGSRPRKWALGLPGTVVTRGKHVSPRAQLVGRPSCQYRLGSVGAELPLPRVPLFSGAPRLPAQPRLSAFLLKPVLV